MSQNGTLKDGKWIPLSPIMTIESLLDYGFREWPKSNHDNHDRHWQFCKSDEKGKKIYVTVRLWEFSKYSDSDRGYVEDSFDAESQFDMNGPKTFNVNISVNNMTPGQVVDWFERMHHLMGCTYYELYEREDKSPNSCNKCGKFLPHDEAVDPFLCPPCKYEHDSGFIKPVIKKVKTRRR